MVAAVSAANFTISATTPVSFTKTNTQTSFSVTNNGPAAANIVITLPSTISDGNSHSITLSTLSQLNYNLGAGQNTGAINIIYSGDTTLFKVGESTANVVITATDAANSSSIVTQNIPLKFLNNFCKYGENNSDLEISEVSINNKDGDDTEWSPLDEITIQVDVDNNGDDNIKDVIIELGIIDSNGKNIVNDLEGLNDKKLDLGTINDGDSKSDEFTFKVPSDFKEETYLVVIKAYKDGKESQICTAHASDLSNNYYESIDGIRETEEENQVVVNDIKLSPEITAKCGEKVQVTGNIVNIGDTDYEDQVKVTLYNKELNLDKEQIIREDLSQGDSTGFDFEFDIPTTAAEKSYTLEFRTYYEYNSGDSYDIISDEKFLQTIKVQGDCLASPTDNKPKVQISAELDPETPEAIAGKQVMIQSTIRNTGDVQNTFAVSVYGNSAWSSLVSIAPESVTLKAGESKQVSIVLNIDKEAVGEKELTIKASSGTVSTEQRVALDVVKSNLQFTSIINHFKSNWFIYLIILVNLVLIIAIIIVIKRMVSPARRRDLD